MAPGDAVVDVEQAPAAEQPLAVGAAVAGAAGVVDVQHREAPGGPELGRGGERRLGAAGGAAVHHDDQRRQLSLEALDAGRPRLVEQAVHGQAVGVGPRPGLGRGDVRRGSRSIAPARASTRSGPPRGPRTTSGEPVGQPAAQGHLAVDGLELVEGDALDVERLDRPGAGVEHPEPGHGGVPPAHQRAVGIEHGEVDRAQDPLRRRRGRRGRGAAATGPEPVSRCTVQHPDSSERNHRAPSGPKAGWTAETSAPPPPATTTGSPAPASVSSARSSVVESHGMLGWSQATQAIDRPSGETAGRETKSVPVASTTPPSALSPSRSSRTSSLAGSGSRGVVLAHGVDVAGRAATRPPKRHGPGGVTATRLVGTGVEPVQAVVTGVREHDRALPHGVGAAAVLVHPGAHVPRCRQHLAGPRAVVAHQRGAAGLARAPREPVGVAAVDPHLVERPLAGGEGLRGDRGGPGAVGEAHRPTV